MNRTLLPLALAFIITSCGEYSGDLPAPPRTPVDPPTVRAAPIAAMKTAREGAGKADQKAKASSTWYERYDLGAIVLELDDGAIENMNGADQPRYRRESYDPGLGAYRRRLAVLRREQKQLVRENARLRAALQSGTTSQLRELRELRSWLAQLSAGQAEVTAHTHAVTETHGALLTQLKRALPGQLAYLEQPQATSTQR